jgi:WhiB family redox-sensing transcriptional regulator
MSDLPLLLEDDAPDWSGALCPEVDPEIFFPEKGDSSKAAKKVCAACDIRTMCLDWSIETRQEFGVWGGLSQSERYAITGRRISYGRTRCVKGHKFTDDNVRIRKDGARVCLACERDRGRDAA